MLIPYLVLPCLPKHVIKCVQFIAAYYDFSLQECYHCFSEGRWPLLSAVSSTSHSLTCGLSIWQGISVFFHQMSSHRMASPCCVIFSTVYVRYLSMVSSTCLYDESPCLWHTNFDFCFQEVTGNSSTAVVQNCFLDVGWC